MEDTQQDNKDYKCGALPHFNMCSKKNQAQRSSPNQEKALGFISSKENLNLIKNIFCKKFARSIKKH